MRLFSLLTYVLAVTHKHFSQHFLFTDFHNVKQQRVGARNGRKTSQLATAELFTRINAHKNKQKEKQS